jgi:hypothetical protein
MYGDDALGVIEILHMLAMNRAVARVDLEYETRGKRRGDERRCYSVLVFAADFEDAKSTWLAYQREHRDDKG